MLSVQKWYFLGKGLRKERRAERCQNSQKTNTDLLRGGSQGDWGSRGWSRRLGENTMGSLKEEVCPVGLPRSPWHLGLCLLPCPVLWTLEAHL